LWGFGHHAGGGQPLHPTFILGSEALGDPVLIDPQSGFRLRSRPDVFSQANRSMVPALQEAALAALGDTASGRVVELFCGAGTLTLPLLLRAQSVVGVDSAGPALQLLRRSADEMAVRRPGCTSSPGRRRRCCGACRVPSTRRCSTRPAPAPPRPCGRSPVWASRASPT